MPTRRDGGTPRQPTGTITVPDRQLTLGECIALGRYGTSDADDRSISLGNLLMLIDRLEVCTTCGWSKRMHEATADPVHIVGLCAQWTREI